MTIRRILRLLLPAVLWSCALISTGCTSGPSGTYSDTMGSVVLELKSGGKANLTFGGEVGDCAYSSTENKLSLSCKGDAAAIVFTIHNDGSLTGPAGSFMPTLRKTK